MKHFLSEYFDINVNEITACLIAASYLLMAILAVIALITVPEVL